MTLYNEYLDQFYLLWVAVLVTYFVYYIAKSLVTRYRLREIPVAGSSSILGTFKFLLYARDVLRYGHQQYPNSAFKIPEMNRWHVVISGREMIDDLRRASDDDLSSFEAMKQGLQIKYTMGDRFCNSMYHLAVVRDTLTRNIAVKFPEIRDEIVASFKDEIPPTSEWTLVAVPERTRRIVSRITNRVFVGLPLCRDPVFRDLNIDFTIDLVKSALILDHLPKFIRPVVAPLIRAVPRSVNACMKFLGPVIQDRLEKDEKYKGKWEGRPSDLISWLIDVAPEDQKNIYDITQRCLILNFASIHTTSFAFTNAIYFLAAHTEYVQPLREEIEAAVAEYGWSKVAMGKLYKLDSFLKESQRMVTFTAMLMTRLALKSFTFRNGIHIPAGTFVSVASDATHHDQSIYSDHETFNGFRFVDAKSSSDSKGTRRYMSTTSTEFVLFGHGRHACPGRFFAVNELKALFAHVLLTYDVKLEGDSRTLPQPWWFAWTAIHDERSKVLFRARST